MYRNYTYFPIKFFFLISVILNFLSCTANQRQKTASSIIGDVKDIPSTKIYLIDAYSHNILDSTNYRNGNFRFHLVGDSFRNPLLVSLMYYDKGQKKNIMVKHVPTRRGETSYFDSGFMTEDKSIIKIKGESPTDVNLFGGIQNETFCIYGNTSFGFLPQGVQKRSLYYERYKKIIQNNSSSVTLLNMIKEQRGLYSNKELNDLIANFNMDVKHSEMFDFLEKFITFRNEKGIAYKQLLLLDNLNKETPMFDLKKKLNVSIFWASWCGPCRAEIPDLKTIISQFKDEDVNFTSISIDNSKVEWMKALSKEKMFWNQLIVNDNQSEKIKAIFNLSGIPLIIITDKQNVEVARFDGNSNIKGIQNTITKLLR